MAEYRIRTPQVVHETVDGEVVAIDFTTGSYFSLRGPAEAAWSALQGDATTDLTAVVDAVGARFADDAEAGHVGAFLDHLVDEGLLERAGEATGQDGGTGALVAEKFTDMEELILLDPVHDVSEAGWPNAPT
jgi:hypothetical protein